MGSADFTGSLAITVGVAGAGAVRIVVLRLTLRAHPFFPSRGFGRGGRNSDIQAAFLHATSLVVLPVSNLGKVPTDLGHSSF